MESDERDEAGSSRERIRVGETADGEPVALPVVEMLTGRGFVTGKSGSGKSNTASVVAEELLERGYPILVVDTDGEYYGLKEAYELLHAGADEECDIQVSPEHAERLATLALEENVPIILDVSGYLDDDTANDLLRETVRHLFAKEKKLKKPFLLVVEECHEYIPEGGGMDETGKMLIKVGKRGRKHGLGVVGISQRPADVKKDFITQANWLVWHRLTWENDTKVVGRIVGGEYGDAVPDLAAGEAFLQTDWTDEPVRRVQFKRKRTFDAGATPGLDDFERPELKSVSDALVDDLAEISEQERREEDRIAELEAELDRKDDRIAELEAELAEARDVSAAARRMADALAGAADGDGDVGVDYQTRLGAAAADGAADADELAAVRERIADLEAALDALPVDAAGESDRTDRVDALQETLRRRGERLLDGSAGTAAADRDRTAPAETDVDLDALIEEPAVATRLRAARRESLCNAEQTDRIVAALVDDAPLTVHDVAPELDASVEAIHSYLSELRRRSLVTRDADRRYAFDGDRLTTLAGRTVEGPHAELREQWRPD